MVYTIVGAETLISPISERGATHQLLKLKDSMQKRGTESLHLISMLNAEKLLSLYQKGEPITITLPQSGYSYRFKIDKVKENNQKKIFYPKLCNRSLTKSKNHSKMRGRKANRRG
jgi:hypothetical protein